MVEFTVDEWICVGFGYEEKINKIKALFKEGALSLKISIIEVL